MFLKMKRDRSVKDCGCTDGRGQYSYTSKENIISPTVSIDSLMISCTLDETEGINFITVDIPGAFMQADMDELVHVKFEVIMAEMLVKIYTELYNRYAVMDQYQLVIYMALNKSLYGTIRASLLFWSKLNA